MPCNANVVLVISFALIGLRILVFLFITLGKGFTATLSMSELGLKTGRTLATSHRSYSHELPKRRILRQRASGESPMAHDVPLSPPPRPGRNDRGTLPGELSAPECADIWAATH